MTDDDPPYKPLSTHRGATLLSLYNTLQGRGLNQFEARAQLLDQLDSSDVTTDPPIPRPFQLRFASDNALVVQVPAGLMDPAQIFIKYQPATFPDPEPMPPFVDVPGARELREQNAIEKLAAKLKTDNSVKRDDYKAEWMARYHINEHRFETHIWPEARERRGLDRHAPPGPKTKSKPKA